MGYWPHGLTHPTKINALLKAIWKKAALIPSPLMRILLVEDDPSLGATLQSWLQLDGYAVDWVRRGDLAETALRTQPYQCVLLDRGLPGPSSDGSACQACALAATTCRC